MNQLFQCSTNQYHNNLAGLSEQPVLLGPIIPTEVGITFKILVKFHHQAAKLGVQVSVSVVSAGQVLLSMRLWQEELTGAFQVYPGSCCKAGGCVSCSESKTSTHNCTGRLDTTGQFFINHKWSWTPEWFNLLKPYVYMADIFLSCSTLQCKNQTSQLFILWESSSKMN